MTWRYWLGGSLATPPVMSVFRFIRGLPRTYIKAVLYHDIPSVSMSAFRDQLVFLKDRYGFVDPHRIEAYRERGHFSSSSGIRILLTFDDGFKSNKVVADEILKPLGINAVFFVPGPLVTMRERMEQRRYIADRIFKRWSLADLPEEMALMDEDDLKGLLADGHVIGAHGQNHRTLSEIASPDELREEIVFSGDLLERRLGVPIEWFAYPFGHLSAINGRAYRIIRDRYRYCCTGVRGINPPGFLSQCILRDPLEIGCPESYVRFVVEDGLGPLYRRKARRLFEMAAG